MFAFPATPAFDLLRNNMDTQISLSSKMCQRMVDTSLQFFNLNTQAVCKLVEESIAAAEKGRQIKTLPDTQAFILEQSQLSFERMQGYTRNAQKIAADSWIGLTNSSAARTEAPPERSGAAQTETGEKQTTPHSGAHEIDPHPSALVEKMISTAVGDSDNLH
jgi:hypothetical protein